MIMALAVILMVNGCKDNGADLVIQAKPFLENEQYDLAVPLLDEASQRGNAEAQLLLGLCYEDGTGVEQDEEKSSSLYRAAADQNNSKAIYKLAESYVHGRGVTQSRDTAFALIIRCAELKELQCMARQVSELRSGSATEENVIKSLEIAQEMALTDYSKLTDPKEKKIVLLARINYSRICLTGSGVDVDSVESLKWGLIYNEHKTGLTAESQENMFKNIRMTYDHLSESQIDEAIERAQKDLEMPLQNLDSLFIVQKFDGDQSR